MLRAKPAFGIALALALASGVARAEGPASSSGSSTRASAAGATSSKPSKEVPPMQVVTPTTPAPVPVPDPATTDSKLVEIRTRARGMQVSKSESVEKQLASSSKLVDTEAARLGDVPVRDRLAAEFGVTPEALTAQREQFGMGWGELMIAHTLLANAEGVTIEQLHVLRQEGLGWGQLAHGVQLNTSGFVTAVKNEVSVARGTAKPDGKPAVVVSTAKVAPKGSTQGKGHEGTPPPASSGVTPPPTLR